MVCYDIMSAYPLNNWIPGLSDSVGIGSSIVAILYLLSASLTILWTKRHRNFAREGMEGAVKHVIFPVYEPFLFLSAASDLYFGILIMFIDLEISGKNSDAVSVLAGSCYGLQHFVLEGVAFALYQHGCGVQSAIIASKWAVIWGLFTFGVQTLYHLDTENEVFERINFVWCFILMIFYGLLWLLPLRIISRRPPLIFYSKVWFMYRSIIIISFILIPYENVSAVKVSGECILIFATCVVFGVLKPIVLYHTLLADSMYWQGKSWILQPSKSGRISIRDHSDDSGSSQALLEGPLNGLEVGYENATGLAQEVANISSQGTVKLINSAYIKILKNVALLGSGSFSKVYRGKFKGDNVAIKMLVTPDLNVEVIKRCCSEAQILSSLAHPNVVRIYGISVLPPCVCIILELCPFGSLADVTRGSLSSTGTGTGTGKTRCALTLCENDRLYLALGCCRGLAALHAKSPLLCHRDIKSFNFLVDAQLVVKIADLELGGEDMTSVNASRDGMLSCWLAPEVMKGSPPTQASDVYSLSLVIWEIFSGKVPYENILNDNLSRRVIEGLRPYIPPNSTPLQELIELGWSDDPIYRPSSEFFSSTIEQFYRASLGPEVRSSNLKVNMDPIRKHFVSNKRFKYKFSSRSMTSGSSSKIRNNSIGVAVDSPFHPGGGSIGSITTPVDTPGNSFTYQTEDRKLSRSFVGFSRGSENAKMDESLNAILKFADTCDDCLFSTDADVFLPTLSSTIASWRKMDSELGACVVLSSTECVFKPVIPDSDVKSWAFTGFRQANGPGLALFATQKFSKLTGYLSDDIIASDLHMIRGPRTDRVLLNSIISKASQGDPGHAVVWLQRRDGNPFLSSVHAFPVFYSDYAKDPQIVTPKSSKTGLFKSLFQQKTNQINKSSVKETTTTTTTTQSKNNKNPTSSSPDSNLNPNHNPNPNSQFNSLLLRASELSYNTRDSDITAFRPSYLRPSDTLFTTPSSPNRKEPVTPDVSKHGDLTNVSNSTVNTSTMQTARSFATLTLPDTPNTIKGLVSISTDLFEDTNNSSYDIEYANRQKIRWQPIDEEIRKEAPVLFVILQFNRIQENL